MERKKTLVVSCVGLLALLPGCVLVIAPLASVEEDFAISDDFDGIARVAVDWQNGAITVRFDDTATEMTVVGTKKVLAATEAIAAERMEDFDILLGAPDGAADQLNVTFHAPGGITSATYQADVEIVLPASVSLSIDNDNGGVSVTGHEGELSVVVNNGGVTVTETTGATDVSVDNGAVVITMQTGDTAVVVDNGSVSIDSLSGGVSVDADTGAVSVDARPASDEDITIRTDVGSIAVAVPTDTAADLSLLTIVGAISLAVEDFTVTELELGSTQATATLNGGGSTITLEASVGGIEFGGLP